MMWNKNIRKWLFIFLGTVSVLLIAPFIVVQLYKDEIKTEIEKTIDENIEGTVTFEKINYSFFFHFPHLTLAMNNVDVVGIKEFDKDTLAHVERIDLKLSWLKIIFFNKIEVDRIVLNRPKVHMHILPDGCMNYNILKKDTLASSDEKFASISLDEFSIRDGVVQYLDQTTNRWLELHGLDHDGRIKIVGDTVEYLTATTIEHVSASDRDIHYMQDKKLVLKMDIQYDMRSNICLINENSIQLNKLILGLDGTIGFLPSGYDFDITVDSKQASFSDILSLIPALYKHGFKDIKTEGLLTCSGIIKGKYFDTSDVLPAFHLDFNISDAMLQMPEFPSKIKDIEFDLVIKNDYGIIDSTILDLQRVNMDFGGHPIKGRFKMQGFHQIYIDTEILAELEFENIEKVFPIEHFDVKGKLNFDLKAKGIYKRETTKNKSHITSIPQFDLNLSVSDGTLKYDSAAAMFHGIQFFLKSSNSDGIPNHTNIDLKALQMHLGDNTLSGNVLLKGLNPYYIKSDLKASMDLADIEKLYPATNNVIKGLFQTDVSIDGVYDEEKKLFPAVNALVKLTNGYLKNSDYADPLENIEIIAKAVNPDGKAENTRVDFDQINFLMEGNPFSAKGYIEDFVKMNYDFTIKGLLDLDKLTKVFPIEGVAMSGTVDTDIETKGSIVDLENKNFSNIACTGNIVLNNIKYRTASFRAPLHLNKAFLKLTPEKIIMTQCNGRVGRTNFSMTGDLINYMYFLTSNNDMITGDLKLTSDTLDLTPWIDKTYTGKRKNLPTVEPAPAPIVEQTAWEVPKNVNFVFDSEIKHVFYQDLHITDLKGEIVIRNGILTLNETGFNSMNAFFSVEGMYNTTDIKHPAFDVHLVVKELDVNKAYKEIALVRKLAPAAGDTYGRVSINYKLAGLLTRKGNIKLESLVGGGNISITNAKINGMKMFDEISRTAKKQDIKDPELKNLSMDSEIHDNKIFVKPFSLKVNGLNADIEGSNDITGGNLNYLIKIELLPIDKMKIPFHVTGTYDDPKVAMGKGKKEG
ncbi:AsmA-like C-terminal region-containing protein [Cytophaga aurantiaca]|uniref:AsmA family protein n=1 Tax=Cytophaga aurantiaca TaxID=29530 RepID=UPI00039EAFE6|nr:AsmA-like C-terminal region-containing protein [Cytophaga aurantiaca]